MKRHVVVGVLTALLGAAVPAAAQTPPPADAPPAGVGERPWAKGVSQEDQTKALDLFVQGNGLLKDSLLVQAVEKYREALKYWDHPAIHYNLAFALVNLDQPVEAYSHLEKAMAFGAAPLDPEKYEHAKSYKALIEKQLARVEISCDEPGAKVTMDGNALFDAPGTYKGLVRAGPHTVLASKEGFLTAEDSRGLPPGMTTEIKLTLLRADSYSYHRKWAAWKPWAVVGGGAAVLGAGVFFNITASKDFQEFDKGIEACGGCVPDPSLADKKSSGELMRTMAVVSYAVGGAALVTGVTLLYINRAKPVRLNAETPEGGVESAPGVSVVPMVGPGEGGILATVRF